MLQCSIDAPTPAVKERAAANHAILANLEATGGELSPDGKSITYAINADGWTSVFLKPQGDNDIRVPKNESEQALDIYRRGGKTVEVKYYPEQGHGFAKRENQIDSIQRIVNWFDRYLKGGTASD